MSYSTNLANSVLTHTRAVEDDSAAHEPSDYVSTLLRDPTSSHLLETLVRRLPQQAFDVLWTTYLDGKLGRLAAHPVANFVMARALEHASEAQLAKACEELHPVAEKIFSKSTGVSSSVLLPTKRSRRVRSYRSPPRDDRPSRSIEGA